MTNRAPSPQAVKQYGRPILSNLPMPFTETIFLQSADIEKQAIGWTVPNLEEVMGIYKRGFYSFVQKLPVKYIWKAIILP